MKFTSFNQCLDILDSWPSMDESIMDKLLNKSQDIFENLILSFSRELNMNLLERDFITGKSDVLKYYIREHARANNMVLLNTVILFDKWFVGSGDDWKYFCGDDIKKANRDECFDLTVFSIYENLFFEIKRSCESNNLDYFQLCKEEKIDTLIYKAIIEIRSVREKNPLENFLTKELNEQFKIQSFEIVFRNAIAGIPPSDNKSNFKSVYYNHKYSKEHSSDAEGRKLQNTIKEFHEYLQGPDNEKFAYELKNTYKGQIGKHIKIMIEVLKKLPNQGRLTYSGREFKALYLAINKYFGQNIGSYNSINDYKNIYTEDLEQAEETISNILKSLKNSEESACQS